MKPYITLKLVADDITVLPHEVWLQGLESTLCSEDGHPWTLGVLDLQAGGAAVDQTLSE